MTQLAQLLHNLQQRGHAATDKKDSVIGSKGATDVRSGHLTSWMDYNHMRGLMLSILACLMSLCWCVIWKWHVETRHGGFNITVRHIISNKTVTSNSSTDTIWHRLLCGSFCLELVEETDKCVLNCLLLKIRGQWLWLLQIEEYHIYAKLCHRWSQVINKRAIKTQHLRMLTPQAERNKFV